MAAYAAAVPRSRPTARWRGLSIGLVMSKTYRTFRITSQAYDRFVGWAKTHRPYGPTLSEALETLVDMFKD